MNYSDAFLISATGMAIERSRVDIAALNLANANTVQDASGATYQPSRVVVRRSTAAQFEAPFDTFGNAAFQSVFEAVQDGDQRWSNLAALLPSATVETAPSVARQVYEPGHPLASKQGFVAYAGVDAATEMMSLLSATRAYEANVAAFNASRLLNLKTLDIGRGN